MLTSPDTELRAWRDAIRDGGKPMVREQQLAMIDEVLRLRQAARRLEEQLLKATQLDAFQG